MEVVVGVDELMLVCATYFKNYDDYRFLYVDNSFIFVLY